jgi:hypothetical protein
MPDKIDVARLAREAEEYAQRNGASAWSHHAIFNEHFARLVMEEAAKVCDPKNKRPCDCIRCDCGNQGNAEAVSSWDSQAFCAQAIRSMKP